MSLRSGFVAALACFTSLTAAQSSCNPTKNSCPSQPGFTGPYTIDFTTVSSIPPGWTLAAYENVTFGSNGAEFTFNRPPDSPYMWTSDYFLFGKIDVVAQAAPGTGIISSIVMISDDLDEVDWEFSGNNFGQSTGTVQTNYFGKGITGDYDRGTQPAVASPQTEFHTYTWEWSSTALSWIVDGTVLRTFNAADADTADHQYPQSPMQLHLGLWDAGCATCAPGTVEWSGGETDLTQAPFTFYVKSVTITPANDCSTYTYGDMSGSFGSIQCGNGTISGGSSATSTAQPTGGPSAAQQNQTVTIQTSCTTTGPTSGNPTESAEPAAASATAGGEASASASASASGEYPSSRSERPQTPGSSSAAPASTGTVSAAAAPSTESAGARATPSGSGSGNPSSTTEGRPVTPTPVSPPSTISPQLSPTPSTSSDITLPSEASPSVPANPSPSPPTASAFASASAAASSESSEASASASAVATAAATAAATAGGASSGPAASYTPTPGAASSTLTIAATAASGALALVLGVLSFLL